MKTILDYPQLVSEWHPTKNGNLNLHQISYKTHQKVWWKCKRGHNFNSSPYHRCRGTGCPYCTRKSACKDNCLIATHLELCKEWHPTKNKLTFNDVVSGSGKTIWWICPKGHEFEQKICARTSPSMKQGCPYCSGKKVCNDNSLKTLYPNIAQEWHPNKNGDLTSNDVTHGSHKNVWWLCPNGHEYRKIVKERSLANRGCNYCNSVAELYPALAKEWHYLRNNHLSPYEIAGQSNKKIWWKCECGNEWQATICNRSGLNHQCPRCASKSKGEDRIKEILENLDIDFDQQKTFDSCLSEKFQKLKFDFYIHCKDWQYLIEFQGGHHYKSVRYHGISKSQAQKILKRTQISDKIKRKWAKEKEIPLLEIPYWEYNNIDKILSNFLKLELKTT